MKIMQRNHYIADFGMLNKFFDEDVSPEDFMDTLTDVIEEYSTLALRHNDELDPKKTAFRIELLNGLHQELRKVVR